MRRIKNFRRSVLLMMALITVHLIVPNPALSAEPSLQQLNTPNAFNAFIAQAERFRIAERFDEAQTALDRVETLALTSKQKTIATLAQGLLLDQTSDPQAKAYLAEALAQAKAEKIRAVAAIAAIELARLASLAGDRDTAGDYARQAVDQAKGATGAIPAAATLAMARYQASFGQPAEASASVVGVLDKADLDPDHIQEGQLIIEAGRIARRAGVPGLAERAFNAARDSSAAYISALGADELADLSEAQGDASLAIQLSEEVIIRAQADANNSLIFRAAWRRGRLFAARGDADAALSAYRVAFGSLRALRVSSGSTYIAGQSLYRLRYGAFHQSFVDVLMETSSAADTQLRLFEARDVIEDLKIDEVEDYFQERCVPSNRVELKVSEVADDTAVIYPIILADRVEVLMELGGKILRATTPIAQDDMERLVKIARLDFEVYGREYVTRASRIYDIVIRPFEEDLKRANTIVYAPDGVLRLLPIAALWDGENFLIENYSVATVLGLSLIGSSRETISDGASLVAGATSVEGFAPLPSVRREVMQIAETLGATVLFEQAFEAGSFGATLQSKPYEVIHIATHAQIGGKPSDNFIATTKGRVDMNQVALTMRARTLATGVPLNLMTLSACATASGDDRAPLGLAGIAYRSGARSVLASLWPVFDNATADLMTSFYQELANGAGRAEALRRAQVRLLSADPSNRHPAVWASFTLVGEWR